MQTSQGARIRVAAVGEIAVGERRIIPVDGYEIGVFRVSDDSFVAYRNVCLHQGGPVCEGRLFPRMTAVVTDDGRLVAERYDTTEPHLVCPWHGWEYDLRTGEFCGDRTRRLKAYPVEIVGEDVYVIAG